MSDISRDIFSVIKELDLPKDQFVIVGSGVLAALDICDWQGDVDLAVTEDIFEHFKRHHSRV